jgi:hypothetical protein
VNYDDKKRIATLQRRADYLAKRIESDPNKCLSFDVVERKAILWAIKRIEQMEEVKA